jgi:hypothetical protein
MFGKLTVAAVMFAALNANAAITTITPDGVDAPGASADKTEIIPFVEQTAAFNLSGSLDLDGTLQKNGNQAFVFGLYKDETLIKNVNDFTASTGDVYSFDFQNLAKGIYSLRFNINGGGNYTFNAAITPFTIVTTPVPEPESVALMLVGLGVLASRRFKKA